MFFIVLFLISMLYGIANLYIGNRIIFIFKVLFTFNISLPIYILIACLALSSILAHLQPTRNWGVIGTIGMYWFAFVVIAVVLFGAFDISLSMISFFRKITISSNVLFITRIISLVMVMIVLSIGLYTANNIVVTKYKVNINKPTKLDTLKVVMFSDLHLGYINNHDKVKAIVEKINKMNPDIIVIPGDFFDGNYNAVQKPQEVIDALSKLESTYGTYISWGNHDAGDSFDGMKKLITSANITLLEDEIIKIADEITLVGRRDSSPIGTQGNSRIDTEDVLHGVNEKSPIIVLDHQPSNIEDYTKGDLILSGHSHQGQIFPLNFITKMLFAVDYGYYQKDDTQAIVTSGVATWGPPIRLGTKSELVEIDINFK